MIAEDESNLRILKDVTDSQRFITEHISIYLYLAALNFHEYLWDFEVVALFIHFVLGPVLIVCYVQDIEMTL